METSNNWQTWQPMDADLDKLLKPGFSNQLQARQPLLRLKKNLFINTIWGVLITIGYIIIIATTPSWPVWVAMTITSIFNLVILGQGIQLYRSIQTKISSEESLLSILKRHHHDITAWCKMQNKLAIWVYPFAAIGGYIWGGIISSGKSFEELIAQPLFVWALPITVAILMPLSYYGAKWMTRKAFGVHLNRLKDTIQSLET